MSSEAVNAIVDRVLEEEVFSVVDQKPNFFSLEGVRPEIEKPEEIDFEKIVEPNFLSQSSGITDPISSGESGKKNNKKFNAKYAISFKMYSYILI